jgi:hypothetical protein
MAAEEDNLELKFQFEKQDAAYRKLTADRARAVAAAMAIAASLGWRGQKQREGQYRDKRLHLAPLSSHQRAILAASASNH